MNNRPVRRVDGQMNRQSFLDELVPDSMTRLAYAPRGVPQLKELPDDQTPWYQKEYGPAQIKRDIADGKSDDEIARSIQQHQGVSRQKAMEMIYDHTTSIQGDPMYAARRQAAQSGYVGCAKLIEMVDKIKEQATQIQTEMGGTDTFTDVIEMTDAMKELLVAALGTMTSLDAIDQSMTGPGSGPTQTGQPVMPTQGKPVMPTGGRRPFGRRHEAAGQKEDTCRHCGRRIVFVEGEGWGDPEATGDDSIWQYGCDRNDTFTAEHEPSGEASGDDQTDSPMGNTSRLRRAHRMIGALDPRDTDYSAGGGKGGPCAYCDSEDTKVISKNMNGMYSCRCNACGQTFATDSAGDDDGIDADNPRNYAARTRRGGPSKEQNDYPNVDPRRPQNHKDWERGEDGRRHGFDPSSDTPSPYPLSEGDPSTPEFWEDERNKKYTDTLDATVVMGLRQNLSPEEIMASIKEQNGDLLAEMGMDDDTLRQYVDDMSKIYGHRRGASRYSRHYYR